MSKRRYRDPIKLRNKANASKTKNSRGAWVRFVFGGIRWIQGARSLSAKVPFGTSNYRIRQPKRHTHKSRRAKFGKQCTPSRTNEARSTHRTIRLPFKRIKSARITFHRGAVADTGAIVTSRTHKSVQLSRAKITVWARTRTLRTFRSTSTEKAIKTALGCTEIFRNRNLT